MKISLPPMPSSAPNPFTTSPSVLLRLRGGACNLEPVIFQHASTSYNATELAAALCLHRQWHLPTRVVRPHAYRAMQLFSFTPDSGTRHGRGNFPRAGVLRMVGAAGPVSFVDAVFFPCRLRQYFVPSLSSIRHIPSTVSMIVGSIYLKGIDFYLSYV